MKKEKRININYVYVIIIELIVILTLIAINLITLTTIGTLSIICISIILSVNLIFWAIKTDDKKMLLLGTITCVWWAMAFSFSMLFFMINSI